ncbi:MAG: winged helix-turn-helix transcriptional regulator, partial [Candidatus Omnitrophica bacterium]|nr:winged helix-turn-helix transcriptional regulator [Candidatus Omnitrophota bacterium]
MPKDDLAEREFELINIIGQKLGSNQRDLSRQMELSLGQTNMLIRRLVSKGYIRITQLNKRKVKYLLTPKGIAEKMQKSVKYTLNTINSIGLINNRLRMILIDLYKQGERNFYILGKSDLVSLVETTFRDPIFAGCAFHRIDSIPKGRVSGLILICQEDLKKDLVLTDQSINLFEEIAK